MHRGPSEPSSTDKIQAALDALVAERRRRHQGPATPAGTAPLLREKSSALRWIVIGLFAAGLHAGGLYWLTRNQPGDRSLMLVVEPAPPLPADPAAAPGSPRPQEPAPPLLSTANQALPPARPAPVGTIEHDGKVIVVPASPPSARPAPQTPRPALATTVAAAAPRQAPPAPAAPARPTSRDHNKAAQDFAYYHFRYKYKVGSANYAVTSLDVRIAKTEEVPNWNRHRSTGEAGLEYYDGSAFRRTTRRFEVLTGEQDGAAQGIEITVK